jgi:hypothetical protein
LLGLAAPRMKARMRRLPLSPAIRKFLRDEERAANALIVGSLALLLVCFAAAVLAVWLVK